MKKQRIVCAIAFLAALTTTVSAHATTDTFTFSFTSGTVSGSGTFTADTTGTAGEFLVTGISGTVDGFAVSSLLAPGAYPSAALANDNDIYYMDPANTTSLDLSGVSFAANGVDYNVYYGTLYGDALGYKVIDGPTGTTGTALTTFTLGAPVPVSATPEPESLVLAGSGILGILGMARRRFRRS